MNVTGLDLTGCPRVARADAAATVACARLLATLPTAWEVDLPPLGQVRVGAVGVCDVPDDVVALDVRRDGISARLCVAAALATRWVDRAIGGGELFAPVRVLGPAERGVLIALLAPLLEPIGWSFALGEARSDVGPAVILRVTASAGVGTMWFQAPAPPPGTSGWMTRSAARLRLDAGVWLPPTTVRRAALAEVTAGDVIVFDGVAAPGLADGHSCGVQLAVGAFRAAAQLYPDGRIVVASRWRSVRHHSTAGTPTEARADMSQDTSQDASQDTSQDASQDASKDPTTNPDQTTDSAVAALAAAPVEVVAELGRITLRGDQILGLAPGVVLGLRVDRTSAVSLRVGGEIWAEGELVNVEGELGVRVTRVLAR